MGDRRVDDKLSTMHVEAFPEVLRDAGSIPAASIRGMLRITQ